MALRTTSGTSSRLTQHVSLERPVKCRQIPCGPGCACKGVAKNSQYKGGQGDLTRSEGVRTCRIVQEPQCLRHNSHPLVAPG